MLDQIAKIGNSVFQHGKYNDRIYLQKTTLDEAQSIVNVIDDLAREKNYGKIFAKIPAPAEPFFLEKGFKQEAHIPGYFNGEQDVLFMAKFLDPNRAENKYADDIAKILDICKAKHAQGITEKLASKFSITKASPQDCPEMAEIYKVVFPTYPFPIHDPQYLADTMRSHIDYFAIKTEGKLVALSSSEIDYDHSNVEMTDFATLPEWLGNRFALYLLDHMESAMKEKAIKTAYTIARAVSPGMNITFAKMGYNWTGTLVNNTNISGQIESMNIWHKPLT